MNSLIILAGGNGLRAKQKYPKQFILLDEDNNNSRLLYNQYAYKTQNHNFKFDEIITVVHKDWVKVIQKEMPNLSKIVKGGSTRTESSYIGLKTCSKKCENVLIHDAARPFVSNKIFSDCLNNL